MTDAPSPRCSSGSVDDFDAMSKQFTAWVATAANWKERYAGAAYSTRIKAAIVDLKWVIAQAEMHPEIGGAAQAMPAPVSEEELARCLYEAEYDGEAYPWRDQPADIQLTYRQQAQKVLRDFRVSSMSLTDREAGK